MLVAYSPTGALPKSHLGSNTYRRQTQRLDLTLMMEHSGPTAESAIVLNPRELITATCVGSAFLTWITTALGSTIVSDITITDTFTCSSSTRTSVVLMQLQPCPEPTSHLVQGFEITPRWYSLPAPRCACCSLWRFPSARILLAFHTYLLLSAQTTIEMYNNHERARDFKDLGEKFVPPFSNGTLKGNFEQVFGTRHWLLALVIPSLRLPPVPRIPITITDVPAEYAKLVPVRTLPGEGGGGNRAGFVV
eukprot:CAMPEP_0171711178 /NCGR_PEP_ID=MMETSP0991-20121206/16418_1 /TAXON_ID=483369 /ORGANISM="non described non described, Strain CCMP2098" /LENGTH=248 /DNA_ID=CAMNT_0012301425 /DNA_START=32 /DNA_END=778 /DNA_ORIENTATION=+